MAMVRNMTICLAVAAMLMTVAKATNYKVGGGDADGWTTGIDYSLWAGTKSFKVGDNLMFIYIGDHSVVEVSEEDYITCTYSSPIRYYDTAPTLIPLTSVGKRYFICGTPGHCEQGMAFEVTTQGSSSSRSPPKATSPPPPQEGNSRYPTEPNSAYRISSPSSFALAFALLMVLVAI